MKPDTTGEVSGFTWFRRQNLRRLAGKDGHGRRGDHRKRETAGLAGDDN